MRPMRWSSIAAFSALTTSVLSLAVATAWWGGQYLNALGEFRGVVGGAVGVLCIYGYAIAVLRMFLWIAPLREGAINAGNDLEFRYQVYILFYLFFLNSLIRCRAIPIPLMRLIYQALGAQLGANTHSAGIIFDPMFVTIGANTIVGESALVVPHVIEGNVLAHYRISIGSNVTIGAHSVVLAGTTIGNNVIIAANSVVAKGTCIHQGETWGGTPARRMRTPAPVDFDLTGSR